jgi:hypothetical protein
MRLIFFIAIMYSLPVLSQTSIYDLDIPSAYGGKLGLQDYKGHKLVIAVVSVEELNRKGALQFWDSLKTANPKVGIIVIPAGDMDTVANDSAAMAGIKSKPSEKFILSESSPVKKDKGEKQHPIVRWLTNVKQNKYFDADVESDQQIYVISESGILYAIMAKGVPTAVLNEVLKSGDVKESPFGDLKP